MATLFDISYESGDPEILVGTMIPREIFEIVLDRFYRIPAMTFQNLFLYAGNSKEYVVYVKDVNLVPIDLTGGTALMTFRETKHSPDITLQLTGDIYMPTSGEIRFSIVPSDTLSLDIRQYVFDVQVTTSTGKIFTVFEGVLTLQQGVS